MEKEESIKGLLGAIKWNTDYSISRLAIFTANEDVIELEIDDANKGLLSYLRQVVMINGILTQRSYGAKKINVISFYQEKNNNEAL